MATYGLPIVLLILVSVAILLAMNRRLRREVSRRRQLSANCATANSTTGDWWKA